MWVNRQNVFGQCCTAGRGIEGNGKGRDRIPEEKEDRMKEKKKENEIGRKNGGFFFPMTNSGYCFEIFLKDSRFRSYMRSKELLTIIRCECRLATILNIKSNFYLISDESR